MGAVWLAEHTTLDRRVAIKFASRKLDAEGRSRFKAEANAAARINSPHIVEIHDVGATDDGTPFCVMELLLGESLRTRLDRLGKLPVFEVAKIVTQVARALNAAHKLRIVHRDIKPGNIFLMDADDDLFVKLLDFGVAKQARVIELTKPGTVLGTPPYMSREQVVDASKVDHRADLWALTVIAYESLTGELPFDGENIGEICAAIWRAEPKAVSQLDDELNEVVDAFFQVALHKEIVERPSTAKALADAFLSAASTLPHFVEQAGSWQWEISSRLLLPQEQLAILRSSRVQGRPGPAETDEKSARSANATTVRTSGVVPEGSEASDDDSGADLAVDSAVDSAVDADAAVKAHSVADSGVEADVDEEVGALSESAVTSLSGELPMQRPRWAVVGMLLLLVVVPIIVFAGMNGSSEPAADSVTSAGEPRAAEVANAASARAVTMVEPAVEPRMVNSAAGAYSVVSGQPSAVVVPPAPQATGSAQHNAAAVPRPTRPTAPRGAPTPAASVPTSPAPAPPTPPPPAGERDLGF